MRQEITEIPSEITIRFDQILNGSGIVSRYDRIQRDGNDEWMIYQPLVLNPDKLWVHRDARVDSYCKIEAGQGVFLGRFTHCASFTHLGIGGGILIMEEGASCGSGARIITGSNIPGPGRGCSAIDPNAVIKRSYVWLKRNCVVFAGATVLPGVTIGEGAVVAASAVVTRDVPDGETWGGVPAKRLKTTSATGQGSFRHSSECTKTLHGESLVGCLKVRWTDGERSWYDPCCIGRWSGDFEPESAPCDHEWTDHYQGPEGNIKVCVKCKYRHVDYQGLAPTLTSCSRCGKPGIGSGWCADCRDLAREEGSHEFRPKPLESAAAACSGCELCVPPSARHTATVPKIPSERGFYTYGANPLYCTYNTQIRVYESSSAEGPHVWLALSQDSERFKSSMAGEAHAHLNEQQARELIARLQTFVDNIPSRWTGYADKDKATAACLDHTDTRFVDSQAELYGWDRDRYGDKP